MQIHLFSQSAANAFSMSDMENKRPIAEVVIKPRRGFALNPVAGWELTAAEWSSAKVFVMSERQHRRGR